ncbi:MAG: D-alanyl-D-alanine carboxypeptidase, partial [Roseibium sp.]
MRWTFLLKRTAVFVVAGLLAACQTVPSTAPSGPGAAGAIESTPLPVVSHAPATAVERGFSALVVNAASGEELYAVDADGARFPASLSKMMTLYLLFEAVSDGRDSLSSPLTVSARAASRPPAKIGLKAGS